MKSVENACFVIFQTNFTQAKMYPFSFVKYGHFFASESRKVTGMPVTSAADQAPKIFSMKPAATAEPITPATLGPIACMRR